VWQLGLQGRRLAELRSHALPALAVAIAGIAILLLAIRSSILVLAIPALVVAAVVAARRPAAVTLTVFVISGFVGSITAFTPAPVTSLVDFLLLALWLGVAGTYLTGRAERRAWLWPALIAPGIYLGITAFEVLLTHPISLGLQGFRAASWYMAAFILVAIAPWPERTQVRIARGATAIAVLVGAYCTYRWLAGSSVKETLAAKHAQFRVPTALQLRFFGSFLSANQLAGWTASMIPFCLAMAISWRGRWRLVAAAAIPLLSIPLLASTIRTGALAAAAGVVVVLGLALAVRQARGRLGAVLVALLAAGIVAAGAYDLTVAGSGKQTTRFANILSPGNDPAYELRQQRWSQAWDDIQEHPWGHGLGTSGGAAADNPNGPVITPYIDSSYLVVGLQQGLVIMLLYAFALVALLIALARRASLVADAGKAFLVIGACGTLAAMIVLFYAGTYAEGAYIAGAWMIVGLGVAQITVRSPRSASPVSPARPGA
jgi:O-antigen ligase/polysaccharide polymerase Wzy-like membrane protein